MDDVVSQGWALTPEIDETPLDRDDREAIAVPRHKGGRGNWNDMASIDSATPEQRIVAAVVRQAISDAKHGDDAARQWLAEDAPGWLIWIATDTTDLRAVHDRIMRLGGAERTRSTAI